MIAILLIIPTLNSKRGHRIVQIKESIGREGDGRPIGVRVVHEDRSTPYLDVSVIITYLQKFKEWVTFAKEQHIHVGDLLALPLHCEGI